LTTVRSAAFGGSFLFETPPRIFTPEDFTPEHRAIARTTEEFFTNEVAPNLDAILHQDFETLRRVLRKSAELGLVATMVPEAYGGMEMDLASAMIVTQGVARDASYASSHGAQAGIGALPVLLFGTEDQKQRYLPKLISAEWIGAYCLTEPQAGSDAMNVLTRVDLSPDGQNYILNGQKMWITSGGFADLFTVFAKVNGEHFTAFLVERSWPGVTPGAEEKKMGLKGSSTTAVYFDNVHVPVRNVLGEIGRGHIIAFNILNLGRLKLAMFAQGECVEALSHSLRYALERKAFGQPIGDFGLIQQKLADMCARMYANESMAYRITGHIEDLWDRGWLAAVEEFAVECSLAKIFGSETLGFVTDEAVQIHGGYGYHQDYAVERLYRDARVYRIFEGTNEINRLLAPSMLFKRVRSGRLKLPVEPANLALSLLQLADESQQELMAAVTDVLMYTLALQSAELRARQSRSEHMLDLTEVFREYALTQIESASRLITNALGMPPFAVHRNSVNTVAVRRRIAARLLHAKKYTV
jgi:alkylation response protein AidB-like acyl-CoA dehydrogenase